MAEFTRFTLAFSGLRADAQEIGFYDVSEALLGFERSLALTTHLVLNGEVITQAPSLKGAEILARPPARGSWEITAIILALATGAYKLGTAGKDTPIGHIIRSAYDYIVSETLGFHVDFDKTLGRQYKELKAESEVPVLPQSKFDAVIEKCEAAIKQMHRPMVFSETAAHAKITAQVNHRNFSIGRYLDLHTNISLLLRRATTRVK
jgi:hypothetical protein